MTSNLLSKLKSIGLNNIQIEAISDLYNVCFHDALYEMKQVSPSDTLYQGYRIGKNKRNTDSTKYKNAHPVKVRFHRTLSDYADSIEANGLLRQNKNYGENTEDIDNYEPVVWTANNPDHIPVLRRYGNDEARYADDIETFRIDIPKDKYYAMRRKKFLNGRSSDMLDASHTEESLSKESDTYKIDVFAEDIPHEYLTRMSKVKKRLNYRDKVFKALVRSIAGVINDSVKGSYEYILAKRMLSFLPSSFIVKCINGSDIKFNSFNLDSESLFNKFVFDIFNARRYVSLNDFGFIIQSIRKLSKDGISIINFSLPDVTDDALYFFFIDSKGKMISKVYDYTSEVNTERNSIVRLNGKYNMIDADGQFVLNEWYDKIDKFKFGYARVELNGKYNLMDINGNIICNSWFDYMDKFSEGLAIVVLNRKMNYINLKGSFIADTWFDMGGSFDNGYATVKLNGKWNFIDTNGNFISEQWFDVVANFNEKGYAQVVKNGVWNIIDTDGKFVFEHGFDDGYDNGNGFYKVRLNGKYNLLDANFKILSDQWFDELIYYTHNMFEGGYIMVKLNNQFNFMNMNGNLLSAQWFDFVDRYLQPPFKWCKYARVFINSKGNYIDADGKFLSDQWFDSLGHFHDGYGCVELNGKRNYIDANGKFLSDQWFDKVIRGFGVPDDNIDYALVMLNDNEYKLFTNGTMELIDTENVDVKRN